MSEPYDHLLEAYARLVIRVGANVQPGQRVEINALVEQAEVARALAAEAYRVGASTVTIAYSDQRLLEAAARFAPEEHLGEVQPYQIERIRAWRDDKPAVLILTGNPNPTLGEGIDPARMAAAFPSRLMQESQSLAMADQVSWTVVAAPSPGWAESVLGTADLARLWEAVAVAMRLDEKDPLQSWREHLAALAVRRDMLNARGFDRIRYRGPGTDLTVGLADGSTWCTAGGVNPDGVEFLKNLPTEEVYTSPDWRRAEGVARTTAPFFLREQSALVEGLEIAISDGRITEARAERGEDAVRHQLGTVPRARHLGEIAIVDSGSRVRRTGLTYKDMLYDENVASHVAWGAGFPTAVQGLVARTPQERIDAGVNQSAVHTDIVIGSTDIEIDGIHRDGTVTPIVAGDVFVLSEA